MVIYHGTIRKNHQLNKSKLRFPLLFTFCHLTCVEILWKVKSKHFTLKAIARVDFCCFLFVGVYLEKGLLSLELLKMFWFECCIDTAISTILLLKDRLQLNKQNQSIKMSNLKINQHGQPQFGCQNLSLGLVGLNHWRYQNQRKYIIFKSTGRPTWRIILGRTDTWLRRTGIVLVP